MKKNPFILFLFCSLLGWGLMTKAYAVLPISHYHDLVAGRGEKGYRDGAFYSALFNNPQGLALSPDGKILYVADCDNNRIRMVLLSDSNRVETLAGNGKPGRENSALRQAAFDGPRALVCLPGNRLVVFDSRNHIFRLLDLTRKTVSTLAGNGQLGSVDGQAFKAALGNVWNLLYVPADNAIYFTEPGSGAVRKLDLSRQVITTLIKKDPRLPRPKALCFSQGHLFVSSGGLRNGIMDDVYQLETQPSGSLGIGKKIGEGRKIAALLGKDDFIYALQNDVSNPWMKFKLTGPPFELGLMSVSGESIQPNPIDSVTPLLKLDENEPGGFAVDPVSGKFFVSSRYLEGVVSLRDYFFDKLMKPFSQNSNQMSEFEYPDAKPARAYRILIVGSSYPYIESHADDERWGGYNGWGNRMESMPKRLELLLNTEAALRNVPRNFEVLNASVLGGVSTKRLNEDTLQIIQRYRIDMVLLVEVPSLAELGFICRDYFNIPLGKDGLPQANLDPEYLLQPWQTKIGAGDPRKFYDYCHSRKWAWPEDNKIVFAPAETIFQDKTGRLYQRRLAEKPIVEFKRKLAVYQKQTRSKVAFDMCFIPIRQAGSAGLSLDNLDGLEGFWKEIAARSHTHFLDLTDPFLALAKTYWPVDEERTGNHLNATGHYLFAYLLSRELMNEHLVPFSR